MIVSAHYDKFGVVIATTVLSDLSETDLFGFMGCNKVSAKLEDSILDSYNKHNIIGIYYDFNTNSIKNRNIELLEVSTLYAKVGENITIKSTKPLFILINNQEVECKNSLTLSFSTPGKYKINDPVHLNLENGFMPVTLEIVDE